MHTGPAYAERPVRDQPTFSQSERETAGRGRCIPSCCSGSPSFRLLALGAHSDRLQVSGHSLPWVAPTDMISRSIQVGQFYHASNASAAVAKIEWHPWGEAGSTLMVMTVDGKLR